MLALRINQYIYKKLQRPITLAFLHCIDRTWSRFRCILLGNPGNKRWWSLLSEREKINDNKRG